LSRDHFLFLLIGVLTGFLAGYLVHEAVVGVQPPRVAAGAAMAAGDTTSPGDAGGAPAAGAQPPMAEVNRLRDILAKTPDDPQALSELANLEFDIQNWSRAEELYQHFLKVHPGDPDVMTDLGITLRAQGKFDQALELFRKVAADHPDHWQSRFNEVVVLAFDKKDLKGAKLALAGLQKLAPDNPDVARLATEVDRLETSS
jgi:tetratricopeptide (TPR) repeat protein